MNKKNTIRLTESDLKKIISESVKKIISERNFESDRYWDDYVPNKIGKMDFYDFAESDYLQRLLKHGKPLTKKAVQTIIQLANDDTLEYIQPFEYSLKYEDLWDYADEIDKLPEQIKQEILEIVMEFISETNCFKYIV
jgi:hypothetical protein